jgi:hypothetical protein
VTGIVIHRSRHTQLYVVVPNAIARDTTLSLTARGLLVFLLSVPPEWHVTADMLAQDNPDSRGAIRKAMTELREARYVLLMRQRAERGRWKQWLEVFDVPQDTAGHPAVVPVTGRRQGASGATRENDVSSQVAPEAAPPAAGGPAAGGPAAKRSTGLKYGGEVKKKPLSLVELLAAAVPGATEREIEQAITTIQTRHASGEIRSVRAYLKKIIAEGDAADLIDVARAEIRHDSVPVSWQTPNWCGHCDERTRLTDEDRPRRCPDCHPMMQPFEDES